MIRLSKQEDIAGALQVLRDWSGLTQRAVSERAVISRGNFSNYERGLWVPNLSTLIRVLDALGYDLVIRARKE